MSRVQAKKEGVEGTVLQIFAKVRSIEIVLSLKGPFERILLGVSFVGTGLAAWINLG